MNEDAHGLWRIVGNVSALQVALGCYRTWPRGIVYLRDTHNTITLDVPDVEGLINLLRDAVAEQNRFAAKMKDMGVPPWAVNRE